MQPEKLRFKAFGGRAAVLAGGGRYDGLVERFVGQPVPATGVSIGVDETIDAKDDLDDLIDELDALDL